MADKQPVGAIDFGYLEGFCGGDSQVVGEVLLLFVQQGRAWDASLDADDAGWRDVVHTIKGAARGIGANALGEACARAEAQGPEALPQVRAGLAAAVAEIAGYLGR